MLGVMHLVDQAAFLHNIKVIKNTVGNSSIMAIVRETTPLIHDFDILKDLNFNNLIGYFGVASVKEALTLKIII